MKFAVVVGLVRTQGLCLFSNVFLKVSTDSDIGLDPLISSFISLASELTRTIIIQKKLEHQEIR